MVKILGLSLLLSLFSLCTQASAMNDQTFETKHNQILQEHYWAQVAEYQLREKLVEQALSPVAKLAIQQKEYVSLAYEHQYYAFVIENIEAMQRYRERQDFKKITPLETWQQEAMAVLDRYEKLKYHLKDTEFPCE